VAEIISDPLASMMDLDFLAKAKEAVSQGPVPTLEETRGWTAHDTSLWADLIVDEREDQI
jgi:hypothetical protein